MKKTSAFLALLLMAFFAAMQQTGLSQSVPYVEGFSPEAAFSRPASPASIYVRPSEGATVRKYVFDAYGPYPILGAGLAAGINQWGNSPPEWHQGAEGYAKRFGSDFGMMAISTTTHYGLSEVLREDGSYYRCGCTGILPRFNHAILSTVTARRGQDGHRAFSISGLVSPYAGSNAAVYGWYPDRFGAKDALRLGSYNLLAFIGGNVALEFLYGGPHTLLAHMHRNNSTGPRD